jgi:hypothetical protein
VLRGVDQRAGRAPRRCAKTGGPTDGATHVRAVGLTHASLVQLLAGTASARLVAAVLRRPTLDVVIPVSPLAWRRWQRSLLGALTLGAAGAGVLTFGLATGAVPGVVLGSLVLVGSWVLRVRAAHHWWVGVRFRAERDEIVVTRVSGGFDADARALFTRSASR